MVRGPFAPPSDQKVNRTCMYYAGASEIQVAEAKHGEKP